MLRVCGKLPNRQLLAALAAATKDADAAVRDAADACLECESDADILDIIHVAGYVRRAAKAFSTASARDCDSFWFISSRPWLSV